MYPHLNYGIRKTNCFVHGPRVICHKPSELTYPMLSLLLLAGDILEVGAQWSIAKKDIDAFERYMAQLKCYYLDYR